MSSQTQINLKQAWPEPSKKKPIVIIACGDIVRDGHIPAYNKAGYQVRGLFDIDRRKAEARALETSSNAEVFPTMEAAVADTDVIFDVASQPAAHIPILRQIPDGGAVLIQKPMGNNLTEAREIVALCQAKNLTAAVNFQLRFAPQMLAIRDFIAKGHLGDPVDLEVHINLRTPWELFPFLKDLARVEIALHSIHYLDLIRSLLGEPQGVFARTIGHPRMAEFAQTKTSAILNYGDHLRCCLSINHGHDFGERHERATIRVEGTKGCAVATLGVLMDYPKGKPDLLDVISPETDGWHQENLNGNWFPDAFVGRMANMQRFVNGEDPFLEGSVEDAFGTMALVEALYTADAHGGFPLETLA